MGRGVDARESYDAFAYAYDQALGFRFFKSVRPLLARVLRKYALRRETHLDLACGTGLIVEYFQSQGWRSIGVDASMPMMRVAASRARNLVAGDFSTLPLRGMFSCITCLYDSLNHVKRRSDLVRVFRSIRSLMDDRSILLFDINPPDVYAETWARADPFTSQGSDHLLEIATAYRSRDGVARALVTGWATRRGRRVRIHETREQRAWSREQIDAALAAARIAPLEVIDFYPFRTRTREGPRKLFYVCGIL